MKFYEFLLGISSVTTALIFIAKFVIKWIGDASLEKYKNELQKETLKFQSNLDKEFETFKIKYSRLHIEQVEIIKIIYSKFIKAEIALEYLMRPMKINPEKTEQEQAREVAETANDFFDYFDTNEIIFNEETCKTINSIRDKFIEVWKTYSPKSIFGESLGGEVLLDIAKDMKKAYKDILQGEVQKLKKELKSDFRKKLGIIEDSK